VPVSDSGELAREEIAGIQRSRILAAAVQEFDERGYAGTTVAHVTERARVARRTFYLQFSGREGCLAAVFDEAVASLERELAAAGLADLPWCERVRTGLWTVLSFLDREPALARVCVVQALGGGGTVLLRRERVLARLAVAIDGGRSERAREMGCTALTAEGVVGGAFSILYARLSRRGESDRPLTGLVGELMGMIVLPYLGVAAARRELARTVAAPSSLPPVVGVGAHGEPRDLQGVVVGDPLGEVPMRLTYRTVRVLQGVGEHPGASNRELADLAGIGDAGQISKLVARLRRLELLSNRSTGRVKGEPNAWTLTPKGELVLQSISTYTAIDDGRGQ
jgi:AcrR family transcriptional regulator